jgi:hypothetical protein
MENCVLYSHYLAFDQIADIIKQNIPKVNVQVSEEGLNKSLVATIPGGLFGKNKTLTINYRQRLNPSYKLEEIECPLTQNLAGMMGYLQKMPAMDEQIKAKLIYKVAAVNSEMAFMAEPEFTAEMISALKKIMLAFDVFVFAQPNKVFNKSNGQYFADKHMNVILDGMGISDVEDLEVNVDAKYHDQPAIEFTQEQLERKSASEKFLSSHGIKVNKNLPCVPGSKTVKLRTIKEVIERTYALVTVAAKGEGVDQTTLDRVAGDKKINSFSPTEQSIIKLETLTDEQRAYATWRYESLYVMLWAIGKTSELKFPSEICDVATLVGSILEPSREDFESTAKLRSEIEILDELDKIYRMNWACVDSRITGQPVGGNIHPGIVYERHYSFNWITSYQNEDWDNVQTNT